MSFKKRGLAASQIFLEIFEGIRERVDKINPLDKIHLDFWKAFDQFPQ